jgi:hypothetical protein
MKKLIKTCKNPLILSAMLFSLAIPAMAGNDTYSPAIREWVNGVSPEWHGIKHFWSIVFDEEWVGKCCGACSVKGMLSVASLQPLAHCDTA